MNPQADEYVEKRDGYQPKAQGPPPTSPPAVSGPKTVSWKKTHS